MRDYFAKNVQKLGGLQTCTKLNHNDFCLMIPQSALVKTLQFHVFGSSYPPKLD